jgi:hypothetical protein
MLLGTDILRGMSAFLAISMYLKHFWKQVASGKWRLEDWGKQVASKRVCIFMYFQALVNFLRFYLTREGRV